jgi:hypothetical protein
MRIAERPAHDTIAAITIRIALEFACFSAADQFLITHVYRAARLRGS